MKKLLMILTVTAFAVVANAGENCCPSKKATAVADKSACAAKATACTKTATACSAKTASCSAKSESACATKCSGKVAAKQQLKSPRHASQS
jgi:hypothetical protein